MTGVRNSQSGAQISEISFNVSGEVLDMSGVVATSPTVSTSFFGNFNGPEKAIDGDTSTSWRDSRLPSSLVLQFPSPVHVDSFSFTTSGLGVIGGSPEDRDPTSWVVEGSQDAISWTTLQTESNFATPAEREVQTDWFVLAKQSSE